MSIRAAIQVRAALHILKREMRALGKCAPATVPGALARSGKGLRQLGTDWDGGWRGLGAAVRTLAQALPRSGRYHRLRLPGPGRYQAASAVSANVALRLIKCYDIRLDCQMARLDVLFSESPHLAPQRIRER